MKYFYNPPLLIKLLFNDSIWHSLNEKILVTFDDGPVPVNTYKILAKLNKYKIKALFFCVGNNIIKNPDLVKEILSAGHHIGNHTMNHKVLNRSDKNIIANEIIPFNKMMLDKFGYKVKYFRPPHGRYGFKLKSFIKNQELKNVMWSLLTYDYKNDINEVKKSLRYLNQGSIVVFHDSIKSSSIISDSIDMLMDESAKKGIITGTPEECLK